MKNKPTLSSVNSNAEISSLLPESDQWIAVSAYYKALARNFAPNRDQDDWLAAKQEYDAMKSVPPKNGLVSLNTFTKRQKSLA